MVDEESTVVKNLETYIVTILMMIFISDKPFRKVLQIFTEVGDYELAIVQN